jgi:hypothetical protein
MPGAQPQPGQPQPGQPQTKPYIQPPSNALQPQPGQQGAFQALRSTLTQQQPAQQPAQQQAMSEEEKKRLGQM